MMTHHTIMVHCNVGANDHFMFFVSRAWTGQILLYPSCTRRLIPSVWGGRRATVRFVLSKALLVEMVSLTRTYNAWFRFAGNPQQIQTLSKLTLRFQQQQLSTGQTFNDVHSLKLFNMFPNHCQGYLQKCTLFACKIFSKLGQISECWYFKRTYTLIHVLTFEFRGNTACRPTAVAGRDRASVWIYDRWELLKTFWKCCLKLFENGQKDEINSPTSNETGGRDFPTFDIYCGPALDPSYLCSLNSFRIVSTKNHKASAF